MFTKIKLRLFTGTALLVLAAVGIPLSAVATPASAPSLKGHVAMADMGPTVASKMISTTITLRMSTEKSQELADFIQATVTPGDPQYRKFLTVSQFRERFAPSSDNIQQFVAYLNSHGLRVTGVDPDGLGIHATGSVAQFDGAFSMQIHDFTRNGQRFHAPASKPVAPAQFDGLLLSMPGLNSETGRYTSKHMQLGQGDASRLRRPIDNRVKHSNGSYATGEQGIYTVGDVANLYQVNPLYQAKIKGQGMTVGIMTLANFAVSDVKSYWSDIGMPASAYTNRSITKVEVDGGVPQSCDCGNDETSLDVEQSGGLAYRASIRVYIAPNSDQGFNDVFAQAVNDNIADTLSISWGEPEAFYFPEFNDGTDYTFEMVAIDQYLRQGAAQGQSVFTAAGDSGAYDTVRSEYLGGPGFDPLSVDYPSSDPYITAAGGTTASATPSDPYIDGFEAGGGYCDAIYMPSERVWGWDYTYNYWSVCLGVDYLDYFSVGGGGGVSSYWPLPHYQQFLQGITTTVPGQTFNDGTVDYSFPDNFAGRNTPDLSLNADPETGYLIYDTLDCGGFCAFSGGTSFVAPQLNGITALVDQAVGSRVGFLNPSIYLMQQLYGSGPPSPFNYVTGGDSGDSGDNYYYYGAYDNDCNCAYGNGAGIGSVNAGDLALAFGWKPPYVVQSLLQQPRAKN